MGGIIVLCCCNQFTHAWLPLFPIIISVINKKGAKLLWWSAVDYLISLCKLQCAVKVSLNLSLYNLCSITSLWIQPPLSCWLMVGVLHPLYSGLVYRQKWKAPHLSCLRSVFLLTDQPCEIQGPRSSIC